MYKLSSQFKKTNKKTRRRQTKYKKSKTGTKLFETSSMTIILNVAWKRVEDLLEGWNLKWSNNRPGNLSTTVE